MVESSRRKPGPAAPTGCDRAPRTRLPGCAESDLSWSCFICLRVACRRNSWRPDGASRRRRRALSSRGARRRVSSIYVKVRRNARCVNSEFTGSRLLGPAPTVKRWRFNRNLPHHQNLWCRKKTSMKKTRNLRLLFLKKCATLLDGFGPPFFAASVFPQVSWGSCDVWEACADDRFQHPWFLRLLRPSLASTSLSPPQSPRTTSSSSSWSAARLFQPPRDPLLLLRQPLESPQDDVGEPPWRRLQPPARAEHRLRHVQPRGFVHDHQRGADGAIGVIPRIL